MARPPSDVLTEREAQIMGLLWDHGSQTSESVRDRLPDKPHNSSVRTMLRVLADKGYVRVDNEQRPAVYSAAVPRSRVQKKAMRGLLRRFFNGSLDNLVQHLIDDEQLTPEQLERLKDSVASRRKGRRS